MYILTDGIDECPQDWNLPLSLLQLVTDFSPVKLLVTCRPEKEIETQFKDCPRIEITEALLSNDLQIYVQWNLEFDEKLKRMKPNTKEETKKKLLAQHGGM